MEDLPYGGLKIERRRPEEAPKEALKPARSRFGACCARRAAVAAIATGCAVSTASGSGALEAGTNVPRSECRGKRRRCPWFGPRVAAKLQSRRACVRESLSIHTVLASLHCASDSRARARARGRAGVAGRQRPAHARVRFDGTRCSVLVSPLFTFPLRYALSSLTPTQAVPHLRPHALRDHGFYLCHLETSTPPSR